MTKIITFLW